MSNIIMFVLFLSLSEAFRKMVILLFSRNFVWCSEFVWLGYLYTYAELSELEATLQQLSTYFRR